MNRVSFPQLAARGLSGREVTLPAGLPGERNVVLIAFRRDQQKLVDTWVPWLEQRAAADPGSASLSFRRSGCSGHPPARPSTAAWRRRSATRRCGGGP
jgi:hypothetical protein